ncbi:MAG: hypothetical protein ACLGJE_18295 [Gammaproteobacteria bacterium]
MGQTAKSQAEAYAANLEVFADALAIQAAAFKDAGFINLGESTLEQSIKLRGAIEQLRALDL